MKKLAELFFREECTKKGMILNDHLDALVDDFFASSLGDVILPDPLLNARSVASQLSLTTSTVLKWARNGLIPAYRIHNKIRFRQSTIDNWIEQHKLTPKPKPLFDIMAYEKGLRAHPFQPGNIFDH
mgnify:CR=1 FL=1